MLALLFNLSLGELIAIAVVALLVFGKRLPEVAAQIAVQLQRARRTLQDLRRETGIDREMWEVRRRFEEAVPRDVESPTAAFRQAQLEVRRRFRERDEPGEPSAGAAAASGEAPAGPSKPPGPVTEARPDDPERASPPPAEPSSPSGPGAQPRPDDPERPGPPPAGDSLAGPSIVPFPPTVAPAEETGEGGGRGGSASGTEESDPGPTRRAADGRREAE